MTQNRIYISFLATLIVLFSNGCTVNKRYHNSGMGIQWHLNLKPVNSCSKIGLDKKKKTPPTTGSNITDNNCSAIGFNSNDQIEAPKTTQIKPILSIETSNNSSSFHHQIRHTNNAWAPYYIIQTDHWNGFNVNSF